MIGYIRGIVSHNFVDHCLIDVQGVGYRVFIAATTRQKLSVGAEALLFTYLNVREDAMMLYGFYTQDEYELFLKLTSVSGIGPKVALGILSAIQPDAFRLAVATKNLAVLTKLPGIGKKTAERVIVELHDKIGAIADSSLPDGAPTMSSVAAAGGDALQQASAALMALGYTQAEIMPILQKCGCDKTVEELIKLVLREFGGR